MDMFANGGLPGEAKLKYLDADFEVIKPGQFVICAASGRKIPLEDLRYWCVDRQEAFWDADTAVAHWRARQEKSA